MPSSEEEAKRKQIIGQIRRHTAEKNARAEDKARAEEMAKASNNANNPNQDGMKTSLTKTIVKQSDTPDMTGSKARFDSGEQKTRKPFGSKGRSPTPNSSSTRKRQPRPMPKPQPKGRKLQQPREDRFWERKPVKGAALQIGKSTIVTRSPHENCFAGLLKMTRKPLADKDVNNKTTPNVVTTKADAEKVHTAELAVPSSSKQPFEGKSRSPLVSVLGKRKTEGDENQGPNQKKSNINLEGSGEPTHNGMQSHSKLEQKKTGTSTSTKFETLLQRVAHDSEPLKVQGKRRREEEDILPPFPKRRAVFQQIGLGDDGYMEPPVQRRERGSRPRGLYNHKGACFINAAVQALHSLPDLVTMDERKTLRNLFPPSLGHMAPELLQKAEKGRSREKTVKPIAEHFGDKAAKNKLKIRPYWVNLMRQMSSPTEDGTFNPVLFQQVCGALFNGAEGPMNGDEQEDVYEFIQKLLPEIGVSDLFEAVFECRKNCRLCGEERSVTVTRAELLLNIPNHLKSPKNKVEFDRILGNFLKDQSIFEFEKLACFVCEEVGQWDDCEGWTGQKGNRLSVAPKYLFSQIPRCDYETVETGAKKRDGKKTPQVHMVKLKTQVVLPFGNIRVPFKDGGRANYELMAAIEHRGKDFQSGHFVTTRNVDGTWFTCNDEKVTKIHKRELDNCSQAVVCLFKKVGA